MGNRRGVAWTAVAAGCLTAGLALAGMTYRAHAVTNTGPNAGAAYAPAFRGERSGLGAMYNAHDGQAFGALALDPLLAHPEGWSGGRAELAYRAARPVLGWLVLATSFRSTTAVGWSLLAWSAIGIGVMAAGAVVLAHRWNRPTGWVPLLLLLPGVVIQLMFGGLCDSLAAGLALLGLAWWLDDRVGRAIVGLSVAALTRESTLLVVLALVLSADRRRVVRLLVPFAVYGGWVGVVWLRLRVLPTDARPGLALPPGNLRAALGAWGPVELLSAAVIVVLGTVAWRRAPSKEVRWLVAVSALFGSLLPPVFLQAWDFSRPLLPVTVVGACLLARRVTDPEADASVGEETLVPTGLPVAMERRHMAVLRRRDSGRLWPRTA